jgi:hypothetical protein
MGVYLPNKKCDGSIYSQDLAQVIRMQILDVAVRFIPSTPQDVRQRHCPSAIGWRWQSDVESLE